MRNLIGYFGIWICSLTFPADAGPWLREKGQGFLSLSTEHNSLTDIEGGVYAEYGFGAKLTLGAKVNIGMSPLGIGDQEIALFIKKPIGSQKNTWLFAYDVGLGHRRGANVDATYALIGASVGRGFSWGKRNGWLTFDVSAELPTGVSKPLYKADTTVGLAFHDQWKAMMQVFVASSDGDTDITLAPSLVWTPKESNSSYQFGFEMEDGQVSARLSLWRNF